MRSDIIHRTKVKVRRFLPFYLFAFLPFLFAGCSDGLPWLSDSGDIEAGEPVTFTTYVPAKAATRAIVAHPTAFSAYQAVAEDYTFTVKMYQEGIDEPLGSGTYVPKTTVTGEGDAAVTTYAPDGTLTAEASALYWPGNAKKYGFEAMAGTEILETDHTTAAKLLKQDRLIGYGFEPLWDNTVTDDPETDAIEGLLDNENGLNFRTAKEWYAANKIAMGVKDDNNEYKKIPLYLQHQRALITIRLKAGEGVKREDLAFEEAQEKITTQIFSYGATAEENKTIDPLAGETTVNYTSSDYGQVADDVPTTEYTAVVEPHNYLANATSDVIARISLSSQNFTFYASNDSQYEGYVQDEVNATEHMKAYNLEAGKHLIITATLGRGSRKILITAYVEDWTETVTTSIVDDYGQAGDPIQINSRKELREFLESDKNKAGNVAVIVPSSLMLEQEDGTAKEWTPQPLNCTLNMAGATFRTNHRVFSTIGSSGNIVNGTISVGEDASVDAAVATENLGTIERVTVVPEKEDGTASTGLATQGGLVITNSGSILGCDSELPVLGSSDVIGGIAAYSKYSDHETTMPIIDDCTVNARVDGTGTTTGGGIVGEAVGRVTNNTYEYGITIMQNPTNFENIIHSKADDTHDLRAYGNSWPTTASNAIGNVENVNMTPDAERYTGVIDSQEELAYIVNSQNRPEYIFRISNDFTVSKASWNVGKKTDILNASGEGNVAFMLDGNNKTITTDAMLFSNIMNDVYDLTIKLGGDMLATPDGGDVMAPLAYSVYAATGKTVTVRNVQVKGGDYRIQAATASGLVVWAYGPGKAVIENCQVKAKINVWVSGVSGDAKIYTGGIVANAARATITRCVFHSVDETLFRNMATTYDGTLIAGPDNTDAAKSIFFGGILGGTAPKGTSPAENPAVLITDCTSWFGTSGSAQRGAIVGYAEYKDGSTLGMVNGMLDGCQGNWWNTTSRGVGTSYNSMNDEQVLGKRNAVTPIENDNF